MSKQVLIRAAFINECTAIGIVADQIQQAENAKDHTIYMLTEAL